MLDGDFDIFGAERAEVDGFESHRPLRGTGDPGLDRGRRLSPLESARGLGAGVS
jgi:hypothetical protein